MISYEIHTFRAGQWKADSVFDSRDIALMEAQKIVDGGRYSSIQVLEETYDEQTNKSTVKTIFKGGRKVDDRPTAKSAARKSLAPDKRKAARPEPKQPSRRAPPPKKRTGLVLPVAILVLIAAIGMAALIGLRYYT